MKRSDIGGFTIKIWGFWIEVVTMCHFPVTLAIYKDNNRTLVCRIGRGNHEKD